MVRGRYHRRAAARRGWTRTEEGGAMRAHTTWLSEAEKSRIVDEAVELLGRVGMRFAGSKVLPLLAERGADGRRGHRHRPASARARRMGGRPVPTRRPDGRPHRGGRRAAGRGRALPLRAQRLRRQDAGLPHRRAPRQHAAGPARVHGPHGTSSPCFDIMWTQVSASDVPLERREGTREYFTLLTETRKHVTFVDCPEARSTPCSASAKHSRAISTASAPARASPPW